MTPHADATFSPLDASPRPEFWLLSTAPLDGRNRHGFRAGRDGHCLPKNYLALVMLGYRNDLVADLMRIVGIPKDPGGLGLRRESR